MAGFAPGGVLPENVALSVSMLPFVTRDRKRKACGTFIAPFVAQFALWCCAVFVLLASQPSDSLLDNICILNVFICFVLSVRTYSLLSSPGFSLERCWRRVETELLKPLCDSLGL